MTMRSYLIPTIDEYNISNVYVHDSASGLFIILVSVLYTSTI